MSSGRIVGRAAALFLILIMVGIAGATAVASTAVPGESGHRLTYSGADNGLLIVGPSGAATYAIPPTTLYLPLFASVPVGGEPVELENVTVLIQGKSQTVPAGVRLDPQQFFGRILRGEVRLHHHLGHQSISGVGESHLRERSVESR